MVPEEETYREYIEQCLETGQLEMILGKLGRIMDCLDDLEKRMDRPVEVNLAKYLEKRRIAEEEKYWSQEAIEERRQQDQRKRFHDRVRTRVVNLTKEEEEMLDE